MPGEIFVTYADDSHSDSSTSAGSTWKDILRWKTSNQLCMICLLPFVLIFLGCVLLGLVWAQKVESSRQIVLSCGMVSFFSGFLLCVIANFCDACGVTCKKYDEPAESEVQNDTMFVDLGDLGPSLNDHEENGENSKSEVQTTFVEIEENTGAREDVAFLEHHDGNTCCSSTLTVRN